MDSKNRLETTASQSSVSKTFKDPTERVEAMTTPEGAKGWVDQAGSAQVLAGGHGLDVAPDASPGGSELRPDDAEDGAGGEPSNAPVAARRRYCHPQCRDPFFNGDATVPVAESKAWGTGVVAYVGCWDNAGHHLHDSVKGWKKHPLEQHPLGVKLDGGFVPDGGRYGPEGVVRFTREDGYTVLGFRDNSIDSRGGSHATFALKGDHAYGAALDAARAAFPFVFARLEARGISLVREPVLDTEPAPQATPPSVAKTGRGGV